MKYAVLRRLSLPVWIVMALGVMAIAPVLALLARLARRLTGRPEPVALVRLLIVYVTGELGMLLASPRSREQCLRRLASFLDDIVGTALRSLRVNVDVVADVAALRTLEGHDRPLLVFSRHAGPGDSVLLVHMLLSRFGRQPGIVMKELLTVDPVVGMVAEHLPCALIDGAAEDPAEVEELARELGPDAALLMFPEGGNFTPERRRQAIEWLRANGQLERATRAEALEHVLAPRPGGVLAALKGARGADVVFAAHTGLGRAASGMRIFTELPRDTTVHIRLWHVAAEDIPSGGEARTAWLDDWWQRLDAWVDAQGAEAEPDRR